MYYDAHHLPAPQFEARDLIWLLHQNIKTAHPSDKLDYHKLGPFNVLRVAHRYGMGWQGPTRTCTHETHTHMGMGTNPHRSPVGFKQHCGYL